MGFLPAVLPAVPRLAPFMIERKDIVDRCLTLKKKVTFINFSYDIWSRKFIWYTAEKISKGMQ